MLNYDTLIGWGQVWSGGGIVHTESVMFSFLFLAFASRKIHREIHLDTGRSIGHWEIHFLLNLWEIQFDRWEIHSSAF